MTPLLYLLFSLQSSVIQQAPVGTQLSVRLTTPVGSYASQPGSPVDAVLIAPVILNGRVILPAGGTLSGEVNRATRVGLGIRHETASLSLEFNRVTLAGSDPIRIATRLSEVDNAREHVTPAGVIQGIRSTSSLSYRVSGYVRTALLWDVHAEVAEWAIKSLLLELPEPEIYYPAGTELTLRLTRPLTVAAPVEPPADTEHLSDDDLVNLRALIASMPVRTQDPDNYGPSDPTNVLLIGSREEIEQAFTAAGWSQAEPKTLRVRISCIRAAAEIHGFKGAPMAKLMLNGKYADMSWQKSLNDFSKRHHIRIWKQPGLWYGQELWLAAATRDVDYAFMRPGKAITHEIDPKVDDERDKVAYDLAFTSCAHPVTWAVREKMPRFMRNISRDPIGTDTRMVVMQMDTCSPPPFSAPNQDQAAAHGSKVQRFIRREILITRNDFMRSNIYYRSYEASRWTIDYFRYRRKRASEMQTLLAEFGPAGSSQPATPHNASLTVQSIR